MSQLSYFSQAEHRQCGANPLEPPRLTFPLQKGFIMNQLYFAMATMQAFFNDRFDGRKDRGATAVEYGLMVGLIAVAIIAIVVVLGEQLAQLFSSVTGEDGLGGVDGVTSVTPE